MGRQDTREHGSRLRLTYQYLLRTNVEWLQRTTFKRRVTQPFWGWVSLVALVADTLFNALWIVLFVAAGDGEGFTG
jgi:hypothetical protein